MPYKMKGFPMVEGTEPMKAMKAMHASPNKAMSPIKKEVNLPHEEKEEGTKKVAIKATKKVAIKKPPPNKKLNNDPLKAMNGPMKAMEGAMKAMDGAMKAMSPNKKTIAKDKRDVNAEWDRLSEGKKRSIIDDYYAQVNPKNPEKD